MLELMTTVSGNKRTFRALRLLSEEYGLAEKRFSEFSELDKAVWQNIKRFAGEI